MRRFLTTLAIIPLVPLALATFFLIWPLLVLLFLVVVAGAIIVSVIDFLSGDRR